MPSDSPPLPSWRRLPIGAELAPGGGAHFRVWAPERRRVDVVLEAADGRDAGRAPHPLAREPGGYWSGTVTEAGAGTRYRYRLDGGDAFPDPASRSQPDGPHGASAVVDPSRFSWSDAAWEGPDRARLVLYELHVGTFTPEGTWRAAIERLPSLADVGVTCLEMMPVCEFPVRFGWGYDGVDLFAPTRLYGAPDDLRAFVDAAHAHGIGVILDVVYNHVGPDGNFLSRFSPRYFSERHRTDWGPAFNFDGDDAAPVREFVLGNVRHWIAEYHLDGLRLDATQSILDDSRPHVIAEIVDAAREAAGARGAWIVGENEPQHAWLLHERARGGCTIDALWNDDWHHAAMVALTGRDEAYYTDYRGRPQEFVSMARHGFLYQGQWYRWQAQRRGTSTRGLGADRFVHFLQNHDQVANSGLGRRAHESASPARWRAMTALLLLGPQTPMLFMGQEFAASAPFRYFADHEPELARTVDAGRRREVSQFATLALPAIQRLLPAPHDEAAFAECRLDWRERDAHAWCVALHRDLLRLRREDARFAAGRGDRVEGAVLADDAFVLRFLGDDADGAEDRLLVVNLGRTVHLDPAPEPLLAPPAGCRWHTAWSSEDPRYGGAGAPSLDAAEDDRAMPGRPGNPRPFENWRLTAECATVLTPARLP